MEYDEFGNPLFTEDLSDDDSHASDDAESPTRLDQDDEPHQAPLRDFDDDEPQEGMQVD
ncbi:hypothetical protein JCM10212_004098, partial [Sporobolomyces blumeae]